MAKLKAKSEVPIIRVGVHEAKSTLSQLLREVDLGHEVEILRNGSPAARLVPPPGHKVPVFGVDEGVFTVPDDFDDEDPRIVEAFGG